MEFEKRDNKTNNYGIELSQNVVAFKLLDGTMLDHNDRQLVLTAVDYALKKLFDEHSIPSENHIKTESIKQEASCMVNYEESNAGFHKRGGYYQRGKVRRPAPCGSSRMQSRVFLKRNLVDQDGDPLKCNICESILHFAKDCPHSYLNWSKSGSVLKEANVLFTGQKKEEISVLLSASIHSATLDTECSSTVAGEQWITCYLDSLTPDELAEVKREPSDTVFKFGGGEQIKSSEKTTLPCWLAGVKCLIQADVVNSEIPLLLTKTTMN